MPKPKDKAMAWWRNYHGEQDSSLQEAKALGILGVLAWHSFWDSIASQLSANGGPFTGPMPEEADRSEEECKPCRAYGILCWVDAETAAAVFPHAEECIAELTAEAEEEDEAPALSDGELAYLFGLADNRPAS